MAYSKHTWLDRITEFVRRYKDQNDVVYDFEPITGTVTEEGTPVTAGHMNNIENAIDDLRKIKTALGTATALTVTDYAFTLTDGCQTSFIVFDDNGGSPTTLNVNSLGAKNIYKPNGTDSPLLFQGKAYTVWYNEYEDCFFLKMGVPDSAKPELLDKGSFYLNLPSRPDIGTPSYQDLTITGLNFTPTVIIINPPLPNADFTFRGLLSYSNYTDILHTTTIGITGGRGLLITPLNESTWDRGFNIRISIESSVFPTGAISGTCYWTALR